ncbi:unnamed protein product [Boreogadus saida]
MEGSSEDDLEREKCVLAAEWESIPREVQEHNANTSSKKSEEEGRRDWRWHAAGPRALVLVVAFSVEKPSKWSLHMLIHIHQRLHYDDKQSRTLIQEGASCQQNRL